MRFVPAGLDVRTRRWDLYPSADATVWEQDEALYDIAKKNFQFFENDFQLLHNDNPQSIVDFARSIEAGSGVLVMFEIFESTYESYAPTNPTLSLPSDMKWETLGLDVCDINGLFSFIYMDLRLGSKKELFPENELLNAFILSEAGNIIVPTHSPFVVVCVKRLLDN